MRLHSNMGIQVVQRAICLFTAIPSALIHALNLLISTTWTLVLLCTWDGYKWIYGRHWVAALQMVRITRSDASMESYKAMTYMRRSGDGGCHSWRSTGGWHGRIMHRLSVVGTPFGARRVHGCAGLAGVLVHLMLGRVGRVCVLLGVLRVLCSYRGIYGNGRVRTRVAQRAGKRQGPTWLSHCGVWVATWLLVSRGALLGVRSLGLLLLALGLLLVLGERSRARRLSDAWAISTAGAGGRGQGGSYVWVVLGSLVLVWGGQGLRKVAGIGRGSVGRIQTWLGVLLLQRRLLWIVLLASVHWLRMAVHLLRRE